MNTTTPTTRRYVDVKVRDMVVGQHVTVPTLHSTFTGDLLHTEALGEHTHKLTIGGWDGSTTTVTTSSDYTGSVRDLDAHPYPGNNSAEVLMIWEGEVVATVTPTPSNDYSDARAARADYDGMIDEEDGYLIRLVARGVTVAEHQNPTGDDDTTPQEPTMSTTTPTPAAVVASALRDAATCYRAGAGDRAAEHLTRALNGMARHDMTAELTGQAMGAQTLASIALPYRAADACENIAATVERIYADEPAIDNDDEVSLLEPESDEPALDAWIDREDRVGAAGSEADWT